MRDLLEMASSVSSDLPIMEVKEKFCDLLLEELKTLKGKDLAPYLSECVFVKNTHETKIVLKFPIGAHIFNSTIS